MTNVFDYCGRTTNKMTNLQDLEREVERLQDKMETLAYKLIELREEMIEHDIQGFWTDEWYGPDPAVEAEYYDTQRAYENAEGQWQTVVNELHQEQFKSLMSELVARGGRRSAWTRRGAAVNAWYARRQARNKYKLIKTY